MPLLNPVQTRADPFSGVGEFAVSHLVCILEGGLCFRQDAEFQFFTDLAVGNQVFDGYCPWQNRQSGCPAYRRVCDHSLSEDSPLSAGREGTVSVAHMADLRAHLAKQRVAKLVLLEKLDYKEKFADVSIQRSMVFI